MLKFIEVVYHLFEFDKVWEINFYSCARWIFNLHKKIKPMKSTLIDLILAVFGWEKKVEGKKVRGKNVEGMNVSRKWMESEMIV
jgi:hypothetical protein